MKSIKSHILSTLILTLCLAAASTARAGDPSTAPAEKSVTDLIGDLKKSSQAATDPQLKSVGTDLSSKLGDLSKSLGDNSNLQGQLQSAVKSLLGNNGGESLGSLQKLTQAKLTPEQSKLAKEVYQTGGAYLVQKNLGSLEGSQSDVAQAVNSLRKGNYTQTLPALQRIGTNAKLTQPQKDLLSSLTKSYGPGLQKAGDALKNIPGIGKGDSKQ